MKSFQLPDISNKFVANSSALHQSLVQSDKDWDLISHNINAINTLLTARFTIPISNELYKERTHIMQTRTCQNCYEKKYKTIFDEEGNTSKEYYQDKTEIPENEVTFYDDPYDLIAKIITGKISERSWDCKRCGNVNRVKDTPTSNKRFGSNATFGVIFEQPIYSILNRANYDHLCMIWIKNFLREVDSAMIAYQKAFFEERGSEMNENIQHIGDT
jgi:hypothetical protein